MRDKKTNEMNDLEPAGRPKIGVGLQVDMSVILAANATAFELGKCP
jgi:hypothetical protein